MAIDPRRVLDELDRYAAAEADDLLPFRWIWGGIDDDTLVVVFGWAAEQTVFAKHWALREHATLFDPVDEQILASIVYQELVEPGPPDRRPIPDRAVRLLPARWRDAATWTL